jgi:hypothetical protein
VDHRAFRLAQSTAAGLSAAPPRPSICACCRGPERTAAQTGLWDVSSRGLFGAPPIRVVLSEQAHSSVFKALACGHGKDGSNRCLPTRWIESEDLDGERSEFAGSKHPVIPGRQQ